ncbi:MAG TPA: ABC transporter substrate-binding protein, partial [Hyphomicrobiaceae bacterium]|nr:ABC transporter substrate-binding protein [Hyphomicrobiaceae bacterium]
QEDLIKRIKEKYNEPWMTENAISTYGDMWIIKEALEMAHKADREAVAEALRTMNIDGGPAKYFPGGQIQFDENGRRVGAGLTIVQWRNGVPSTVAPPHLALAEAFWPKK